jgi:GntR family transcriptional regulator
MVEKAGGRSALVTPLHQLLQLRRDTAMPLYQQIEEQIIELLQSGGIADGATLPAERQLAEALGVSRSTIQNCYNSLRAKQLLRGEGRHGSIVQARPERLRPNMDRLKGFTQEMRELGKRPSTRVLEHEVVTDRSMASLFGLHSQARFLRLVRVRLGDDEPLSLESAWYSLDVAPGLADADPSGSIYTQLAIEGIHLDYCEQSVEATMPTHFEASVFGFDSPVPCLLIKRRSHMRQGVMVEYVEGLFRGDNYVYRLRLDV